jgi:diguanylate cyclase (GGDEF)-like protein
MGPKRQLLVIAEDAVRDALARALPSCEVVVARHGLDGVWKAGRGSFDGALVSLSVQGKVLQAIRTLRQIAPKMRIVVGCHPADEPIARRAMDEGADDYVLEPLQREEVEQAFHVAPARPPLVTGDVTGPALREFPALSDVLRNLGDGTNATLGRLAQVLQEAFNAAGVTIDLDELSCTVGEVREPALEEAIVRGDELVGRVILAPPAKGAYDDDAAAQLVEHVKLIEAATSAAREREQWRTLAWTDDLSALHNRRYLEQTLDELIQRALEKRLRLTIVLFDIDDFKTYNDRFGHETGDKLIQEVAVLLKRCTRERDIIVRYGGDEFIVVFWDAEKRRVPGSEHPREAMHVATRFRRAIAEHDFECLGPDAPGPVTISGGLACFPWNGNTRAQLLAAADEALLEAKRTGKNRIRLAGGPNGKATSDR